ncbi:hypothetical protein [Desulfobacula sp.]|uniref:hypothetical protein n=1 Tax=Desulfobacula sp. TaxID=2593537 RepID=UPI00260D0140|nr:hypothetical protein [Desulfobacula sp.]
MQLFNGAVPYLGHLLKVSVVLCHMGLGLGPINLLPDTADLPNELFLFVPVKFQRSDILFHGRDVHLKFFKPLPGPLVLFLEQGLPFNRGLGNFSQDFIWYH